MIGSRISWTAGTTNGSPVGEKPKATVSRLGMVAVTQASRPMFRNNPAKPQVPGKEVVPSQRQDKGWVLRMARPWNKASLFNGMLKIVYESCRICRGYGENLPGGSHQKQLSRIGGQELDIPQIGMAAGAQYGTRHAHHGQSQRCGEVLRRTHPFHVGDGNIFSSQPPFNSQIVPVERVAGFP